MPNIVNISIISTDSIGPISCFLIHHSLYMTLSFVFYLYISLIIFSTMVAVYLQAPMCIRTVTSTELASWYSRKQLYSLPFLIGTYNFNSTNVASSVWLTIRSQVFSHRIAWLSLTLKCFAKVMRLSVSIFVLDSIFIVSLFLIRHLFMVFVLLLAFLCLCFCC